MKAGKLSDFVIIPEISTAIQQVNIRHPGIDPASGDHMVDIKISTC